MFSVEGLAVDDKGNQDGWVCVKFLNTPDNAAVGLLVIDNQVASARQ